MKNLPTPGPTFALKKHRILSQLSVPDAEYTDASPKGSVDAGIRHLIDQINAREGLVTTSSCAGRVSVYLEGVKASPGGGQRELVSAGGTGAGDGGGEEHEQHGQASSAGGKGGGEWLFVSHDPVEEGSDGEGGEEGYERLLLGLGPAEVAGEETGQYRGLTASSRLIHFKFEPMVCLEPSGDLHQG
jgi:tRNA wybutosine-synthesizing protein 3